MILPATTDRALLLGKSHKLSVLLALCEQLAAFPPEPVDLLLDLGEFEAALNQPPECGRPALAILVESSERIVVETLRNGVGTARGVSVDESRSSKRCSPVRVRPTI